MSDRYALVHCERELLQLEQTCACFLKNCLEGARALSASVTLYGNQIPRSAGVFIGADERRAAYRAVCRMMVAVEPSLKHFREALAKELAPQKVSELQCRLAELAMQGENGAVAKAVAAMEKRLRDSILQYQREVSKWHSFYTDVLSTWLVRMEDAADLCHGGQGCDPHAVIALCGNLSAAFASLLQNHQSV